MSDEMSPQMTEEVIEIKTNKNEDENKIEIKQIENKPIDQLTDSEKTTIIQNARNGIDNQYYSVKMFKNGNTRICKKKKPSVSESIVNSGGKREVQGQQVYFTDQQLIWEHLIELERNYAKLYGKHKKMKARYNDLVYEPDEDVKPIEIKEELALSPELQRSEPKQIIKEQIHEEVRPEVHEELQIQSKPQQIKRGNWRSQLINSNFYMN